MSYRKYARDKTRGKSMIDPVSYKDDCFVQVWMNSRTLAMLSEWLDKNGMRTRFLTDVVKVTMDQVLGMLLNNGEVEKIEYCQEARDILESKYKVNLNSGGRGEKNLIHNLVLDERRRSSQLNNKQTIEPVNDDGVDWDQIKRQIKKTRASIVEGEIEDNEQRIKDKDSALMKALDSVEIDK